MEKYLPWEIEDTPASLIHAVVLIKEVYAEHPSGGDLHIVLDDWNLEDANLAWCRGYMDGKQAGKPVTKFNDQAPEYRLAALLAFMTERQRAYTLATAEGWV